MKSALVKSVFQDELARNQRLVERYEKELQSLPKGSVFKRKIGNQEYYYLNYREGQKVTSKFLGNINEYDIEQLQSKLNKRKEYQSLLKNLKAEQKELQKELR